MLKTSFTPGCIVVSSINLVIEHNDLIAYTVEFRTKYARHVSVETGPDRVIKICLDKDEHTDYYDRKRKYEYTFINFEPTGPESWYVFCCKVSHYSMNVVLYKVV